MLQSIIDPQGHGRIGGHYFTHMMSVRKTKTTNVENARKTKYAPKRTPYA